MKQHVLIALLSLWGWGQTLTAQQIVTGKVTDVANSEALPGVTVLDRASGRGVSTDENGAFSINTSGTATLEFSFVGYTTQTVAVNNQTALEVALVSSVNDIEEVVVVGYGSQKKATLTGAQSSFSNAVLTKRQVASTTTLLQGLAPGITVTQQSGQPGRDFGSINIRGVGSLSASTTPLILVDNVPVSSLDIIDPNNIENITVLKDAASTAIYGAQAANGVILVTTKRAKTNGVQIGYSNFVTWQEATNLPEKVSAIEHMELYNVAKQNVGQALAFPQTLIDAYKANPVDNFQYFNTDWKGEVLTNSGLMHNHNLNMNVGTDNVKLYGAGTYLNQEGLTQNTSFRKYELRLNSDVKISEKLNLQADIAYTDQTITSPAAASPNFIIRQMLGMPANAPGKFSEGQYGDAGQSTKRNPIAQAEAGGVQKINIPRTIIRTNLVYRPFKSLELQAQYAGTNLNIFNKGFVQNYQVFRPDLVSRTLLFDNIVPGQNRIFEEFERRRINNYLAQATFSKTLGRHALKVLGGMQAEDGRFFITTASRTDLPSDQPFLNVGTGNISNSGGGSENAIVGFFGRFSYIFADKYLLEVNGRYDGSSRFSQARDRQWGFFPSVSAGWVLSEENFIKKGLPWLSFAKVRVSYGQLGNQNVGGNYPFASNLNSGIGYNFNNKFVTGVGQVTAGNPDIGWETSEQRNLGLDLTIKNAFSITFDVYQRKISDLLLRRPIPNYVGIDAPLVNVGSMENTGWELTLGYKNRIGKFRYDITAFLSDVTNKATDLSDQEIVDGLIISREGSPIGSYYGYQTRGLFQSAEEIAAAPVHFPNTKPGDIQYVDQNGDKKIDGADRVVIGNNFPRYEYSANINLGWRGFDLNALLQGVGRRDNYISGNAAWAFFASDFISTAYTWQKDYWTPENPGASYPRLTDGIANNQQGSDFWMRDGSYLRLKNVQLGYTLPRSWMSRAKWQSLQIFISGQNLLTQSNFVPGFDPERENNNADFYPIMKTYTVGANLRL